MSYKIVAGDKPQHVFHKSVNLDLSRITAILFRQSRRGSDKLHIESRLLQESLIPFVKAARDEDTLDHIHIFDEGSGVSGTKGFDKRKKLRSMMEEVTAGIIGDICMRPP